MLYFAHWNLFVFVACICNFWENNVFSITSHPHSLFFLLYCFLRKSKQDVHIPVIFPPVFEEFLLFFFGCHTGFCLLFTNFGKYFPRSGNLYEDKINISSLSKCLTITKELGIMKSSLFRFAQKAHFHEEVVSLNVVITIYDLFTAIRAVILQKSTWFIWPNLAKILFLSINWCKS